MSNDGIIVEDDGYKYRLTLVDRYNDERVLQEAAMRFKSVLGPELATEYTWTHAGYEVRAVRLDAGDECYV